MTIRQIQRLVWLALFACVATEQARAQTNLGAIKEEVDTAAIASLQEELQKDADQNAHLKDSALIVKAKATLLAKLKDASSAKFQNVHIGKIDSNRFVCGELNAKNSYGAYTGFLQFLTDGVEVTLMEGSADIYQISLMAAGYPANFARAYSHPALTKYC